MSLWKFLGAVLLSAALPAAAYGQDDARNSALRAAGEALVQSDAAFAKSVADKNREAFASFIAEAVTFNGGTPNELRGRDAVVKEWSAFFEPDGPTLTWAPVKGEAIGNGELGYTTGRSIFRQKGADGVVQERRGEYVTIWRKQADGSWKVVFDTGATLK